MDGIGKRRSTLFVDMDGVLADFDAHHEAIFGIRSDKRLDNVDWSQVDAVQNFYFDVPPMADLMTLWNYIEKHNPIILTGVPHAVRDAVENKKAWVRKHFGASVEVRCCKSREKSLHAIPGDILIDDWDKYKDLWLAKGGRWITHSSALETISVLQTIGF